ncbi:TetR family transcriptional regulator C-terminal domain-containing protein [Crossiella sp. CA-258035]|uniref:TetR/AcrR family transcriptional regulator n=1 Tax=Crossiella sp. CA-258035 TaxID=2981138 RepID=UPI0024BC99CC|nr:TetR family transcriptional regulator C-terminal domain-containing protein [Crossiella sp. CA-258035]WHT20654.1 TetR family transcriptional regulator C-terminal domain-containing protein [Crossiella sp. CA-258035]
MPRIVDHGQRRRMIAEALLRLVARDGIETVSVRTVAAEAGMSAGAVQKYFATKEEIFEFALELTGERLERRWATLSADGDYLTLLRDLLLETLPLDAERRAEMIIVTAFTARAAVRADWSERLHANDRDMRTATAAYLRTAQEAGQVRADLPVPTLADLLLALSDGFALRLLHLPLGAPGSAELLAALDLALRELLVPRG